MTECKLSNFGLTVVAVLASIAAVLPFDTVAYQPAWVRAVPPYVIGSVSAFWVIQRLAAF